MKESTFTVCLGTALVLLGLFADGLHVIACSAMGFLLLLTSCVCRAIEKNGRDL